MKLNLEAEDKQYLKDLCAKYLAKGREEIRITYSGSGDSMDYTEVADENPVAKDEEAFLTDTLFDQVMEQTSHEGFWNNEGGQGTLIINTTTCTLRLEHEDNVIETIDTDTDFTLEDEDESAS